MEKIRYLLRLGFILHEWIANKDSGVMLDIPYQRYKALKAALSQLIDDAYEGGLNADRSIQRRDSPR